METYGNDVCLDPSPSTIYINNGSLDPSPRTLSTNDGSLQLLEHASGRTLKGGVTNSLMLLSYVTPTMNCNIHIQSSGRKIPARWNR